MPADINTLLKNVRRFETITLPPGCYEGEFCVSKPCTINGRETTLWSSSGIPLTVKGGNTKLNGLRLISVTGGDALYTQKDTLLNSVEITGSVTGKITDKVNVGNVFDLGNIHAGESRRYSLSIFTDNGGRMISHSDSVTLSDEWLKKGENDIFLTVSGLQRGFLLMAEIEIMTLVRRRVYVTGRAI